MSNIPSSNQPGSGPANGALSAGGSTLILGEKFAQVFHLSNVLRQSGTVSNQLTLSLPTGGDLSPSGPALVVVTWPAQWDFFSLDLELEQNEEDLAAESTQNEDAAFDSFIGDASSSAQSPILRPRFTRDATTLSEWLERDFGFPHQDAVNMVAAQKMNWRFIAGIFTVPAILLLDVHLDTDNLLFQNWSKDKLPQGKSLKNAQIGNHGHCILKPKLWTLATKKARGHSQWTKWLGTDLQAYPLIGIDCGQVGDLLENTGYLGFDIGNNASTIAHLRRDGVGDHSSVELLPADPVHDVLALSGDNGRSVLSTVRIEKYANDPAHSVAFPPAVWKVGMEAVEITSIDQGQLFYSVKRLLGDPSNRKPLMLTVDQGHQISRMLPAELLITSMVRRVHQATQQLAYPVVATYPSTYTKTEIEQIRFGIAKAICRARNRCEVDINQLRKSAIIAVPRMYDEASAAAFFFIFRDFIRGPARLHGFHYLYPQGVNLLLIDCGGGTTDIALIHAKAYTGNAKTIKGDEMWRMDLANLGRTGNRFFGGDNVTAAFFRVLKWCLAASLQIDSELSSPPSEATNINDVFIATFESIQSKIDAIIPTRRLHAQPHVTGNTVTPAEKRRLQSVGELWDYAEVFKKWFSGNCQGVMPRIAGNGQLARLTAIKNRGLGIMSNEIEEIWRNTDFNAEVIRAAVDRLITDEVERLVSSANSLVTELEQRLSESKRERGLPTDSHEITLLHHVYLVGQGALYPLVQQRLEQSLQIPFLGPPQEVNSDGVHPRFVFDRSNLKGAVARGAVLLRMAEKSIHGVEVTYDEDLSERLPFTIGYDENKVSPQTLFKEHQRYRELIEKKLPVPEGKSKKGASDKVISLTLKRRWPGDENWEPFLEFYFDKAIADQSTRINVKRPEPYIRLRFSDDPNNSDTLGFVAELVQDYQTTSAATLDGTAAASGTKVITRVIEKGRGRVIHRHPIVSPRESGDL